MEDIEDVKQDLRDRDNDLEASLEEIDSLNQRLEEITVDRDRIWRLLNKINDLSLEGIR